jgi:signal transduction histidine kinase
MTGLLLDTELSPEQREFAETIRGCAEALLTIINDILDLSKIESGRMQWHMAVCDPKEIILDALAATGGLFKEKDIALQVELDPRSPPVRVDRDRLMQVVINLLSNAAKFVPAGTGRVRVRMSGEAGALALSVEDNGPGIPAGQQEAVFEKFRQAGGDKATGKPKGSGLGLTICRQIVEHFGGRIWVEPATPRGAVFRFTLPAAARARAAEPSVAAAGED